MLYSSVVELAAYGKKLQMSRFKRELPLHGDWPHHTVRSHAL
jgi:hypothetical protein